MTATTNPAEYDIKEDVELLDTLERLLPYQENTKGWPDFFRIVLDHESGDGRQLLISSTRGKWTVYGNGASVAAGPWDAEEINVACTRGPEVLVREIQRRLLPNYDKQYAAAYAIKQKRETENTRANAFVQEVGKKIGKDPGRYAANSNSMDAGATEASIYVLDDLIREVEVTGYSETIRVKTDDLTIQQFEKLQAFLRELSK